MALFLLFPRFHFPQAYLVHQYSEADGLPSSTVYDITQDRQGRMWFATRAGIAVYDGVSWQKYTMADGLPLLSFFRITVDRKGRIWALSDSRVGGILVVYRDVPGVDDTAGGNRGAMWHTLPMASTRPDELNIPPALQLLEQTRADFPVVAVGTANDGVLLWQGGKWRRLAEEHGLPSNSVNGIAALGGKLYVATTKGLSMIRGDGSGGFRIDNRCNQRLGLLPSEIKGVTVQYRDKFPDARLKYSRIWFYSSAGLGYFDAGGSKLTFYPVKSHPGNAGIRVQLLPDYFCGLYVANHKRVYYFNNRTASWEPMGIVNNLISEGANSLFIDDEKIVWISCDRGVSKIPSRRFRSFQRIHGLLEDEVSALLEIEPGNYVFGHNQGVTFYDGIRFQTVSFTRADESSPSQMRVLEMQADSQKNIWIAASSAGLAKINPQQPHQIKWYGRVDGLPGSVTCLWLDSEHDGSIWVGTEEGIFLGHTKETGFAAVKIGEYGKINPRRIYGTAGKLCYIGTIRDGIYVAAGREHRWKHYRVEKSHLANCIYTMKKDRQGRLLIGTLAGLFILEQETLKKFNSHGFHLDRPVYFILEDPKQRLWFGTDHGVVRWDGEKVRQYSAADGLIGNETNRAAAVIDSKGRVCIGTNRSVSFYEEAFDVGESLHLPPRVRLLALEVSQRRIPLQADTPVRLSFEDNTVTFHFRGISFLDERSLRFKSKLEGYDREWSKETYPYKQSIRYTRLPPGSYRILLKARNALGVWSEAVVSPPVIIMPPFYRTWWFIVLVAFLVAAVFYGILRLVSQKRYATLLEKQVEERTQQLQATQQQLIQVQKMEAIGTLAGGIAHDFNNILAAVMGYTELVIEDAPTGSLMHRNLKHILNATQRAAELVKQILAFSRQSQQEHKPLILSTVIKEALKLIRSSLPATIAIRQYIQSDSTVVLADPTQIHQVMLNLGANAAHAMRERGGVLDVRLQDVHLDEESITGKLNLKPGPYVRLTVSDTGHGISEMVMKRIFEPYFTTKETGEGTGMGLAMIHGIVKSHGGDIVVYSETDKGTTFHVFFPKFAGEVEPEHRAAEQIPGGTERILLVDDEAAVTEVGTQILKRLGYDVVGMSSAPDALAAFRQQPETFQLIISDLTMPHLTGIQLAEKIRHIKPDMPIIICSGFSAALSEEQIKARGIDDFILKPVVKTELARVVRRVLDNSHRGEAAGG
jgi:signal transduction histidine kinase/ligand-binding sensor domain-containing protein/ActR/RegA family two-component response regulator